VARFETAYNQNTTKMFESTEEYEEPRVIQRKAWDNRPRLAGRVVAPFLGEESPVSTGQRAG